MITVLLLVVVALAAEIAFLIHKFRTLSATSTTLDTELLRQLDAESARKLTQEFSSALPLLDAHVHKSTCAWLNFLIAKSYAHLLNSQYLHTRIRVILERQMRLITEDSLVGRWFLAWARVEEYYLPAAPPILTSLGSMAKSSRSDATSFLANVCVDEECRIVMTLGVKFPFALFNNKSVVARVEAKVKNIRAHAYARWIRPAKLVAWTCLDYPDFELALDIKLALPSSSNPTITNGLNWVQAPAWMYMIAKKYVIPYQIRKLMVRPKFRLIRLASSSASALTAALRTKDAPAHDDTSTSALNSPDKNKDEAYEGTGLGLVDEDALDELERRAATDESTTPLDPSSLLIPSNSSTSTSQSAAPVSVSSLKSRLASRISTVKDTVKDQLNQHVPKKTKDNLSMAWSQAKHYWQQGQHGSSSGSGSGQVGSRPMQQVKQQPVISPVMPKSTSTGLDTKPIPQTPPKQDTAFNQNAHHQTPPERAVAPQTVHSAQSVDMGEVSVNQLPSLSTGGVSSPGGVHEAISSTRNEEDELRSGEGGGGVIEMHVETEILETTEVQDQPILKKVDTITAQDYLDVTAPPFESGVSHINKEKPDLPPRPDEQFMVVDPWAQLGQLEDTGSPDVKPNEEGKDGEVSLSEGKSSMY